MPIAPDTESKSSEQLAITSKPATPDGGTALTSAITLSFEQF